MNDRNNDLYSSNATLINRGRSCLKANPRMNEGSIDASSGSAGRICSSNIGLLSLVQHLSVSLLNDGGVEVNMHFEGMNSDDEGPFKSQESFEDCSINNSDGHERPTIDYEKIERFFEGMLNKLKSNDAIGLESFKLNGGVSDPIHNHLLTNENSSNSICFEDRTHLLNQVSVDIHSELKHKLMVSEQNSKKCLENVESNLLEWNRDISSDHKTRHQRIDRLSSTFSSSPKLFDSRPVDSHRNSLLLTKNVLINNPKTNYSPLTNEDASDDEFFDKSVHLLIGEKKVETTPPNDYICLDGSLKDFSEDRRGQLSENCSVCFEINTSDAPCFVRGQVLELLNTSQRDTFESVKILKKVGDASRNKINSPNSMIASLQKCLLDNILYQIDIISRCTDVLKSNTANHF